MNIVRWSSDMRLGLPRIDAAHESFFRKLEELAQLGDQAFCAAFLSLIADVESDFREEEAVMEDVAFPGLHVHREQHARILGALHHVSARVMDGDVAQGREAAELLQQWFLAHLSTFDTALALALELAQADSEAVPEPPVP